MALSRRSISASAAGQSPVSTRCRASSRVITGGTGGKFGLIVAGGEKIEHPPQAVSTISASEGRTARLIRKGHVAAARRCDSSLCLLSLEGGA